MPLQFNAIVSAALSLPAANRAALAEKLLGSLGEDERQKIEAAWLEDVENRLQGYQDGKITAVPGEKVFRSLPGAKQP